MKLQDQLANIQQKLKAPKNQYNSFSKFYYRSCEDILNAVKPLLQTANGTITLKMNDEVVNVGDRYYVKATITLVYGEEQLSNTAYAREEESKKGMDGSQITGAASSYARKYALNGLFAIDDTKDADTMDNRQKEQSRTNYQKQEQPKKQEEESSKVTLYRKLKQEAGMDNPDEEAIKEIISKKTGINVQSKDELSEEKCKNLLQLWF